MCILTALGKLGQGVAPIFQPLGFGQWQTASSLVTGLIAKEIVVTTMGQIYAKEEEKQEFGTWKWFRLATGYGLILAWLVALIIYQGGKLLGFGG
jgi:ferrous iron transport protein B